MNNFMKDVPIFDLSVVASIIGKRIEISNSEKAIIDQSRNMALEAIIGDTTNFLPYSFLEEGMIVGRSVGRVNVRMDRGNGAEVLGYGTGFLVAPSILMTNAHVLPTPEFSKDSLVQFNYEMDMLGNEEDPSTFKLDPDALFITSPKEKLDFTLVKVAEKDGKAAGEKWGTIRLINNPAKVMVGENVNIIEHPNGRRKEVVIQENEITGLYEGGYIHYEADTLRGSSGSPVFNNQWFVVAIHHSGVYKRDQNGDVVIQNGEPVYQSNEGIRISSIVEYLRSDAVPENMRALRSQQ